MLLLGGGRRFDGCVRRSVRVVPGRLNCIGMSRQDRLLAASEEANAWEVAGRRNAYVQNHGCVTAPGHRPTVHTDRLIREDKVSWGSPGQRDPWELRSLGQGVGYNHPPGVSVWADTEDFRGHTGAPARRHMLCCKVSCVRATEHRKDQPGELQGSVGCLLLDKRGQGQPTSQVGHELRQKPLLNLVTRSAITMGQK